MDKKTAVIYLASGNSKRFGEDNKLLKEIGTKPMYRYGLDRLAAICKDCENCEIIVVTQYEEIIKEVYEEIIQPIQRIEVYKNSGQTDKSSSKKIKSIVKTTFCPESKYGISWSIKAGIKAAEDADYYAFFVADQPDMKRETIEGFLSFMADGHYELGCIRTEENLGNPVWFSKKYKKELLSLNGDCGGKKILKKHIENVKFFKVLEESELCDIDYPKEMQAMLAKRGKSS